METGPSLTNYPFTIFSNSTHLLKKSSHMSPFTYIPWAIYTEANWPYKWRIIGMSKESGQNSQPQGELTNFAQTGLEVRTRGLKKGLCLKERLSWLGLYSSLEEWEKIAIKSTQILRDSSRKMGCFSSLVFLEPMITVSKHKVRLSGHSWEEMPSCRRKGLIEERWTMI